MPKKTKKHQIRRMVVVTRLQQQLDSGVKREKETNNLIPLTDKDVKRIKQEIETLNTRLS